MQFLQLHFNRVGKAVKPEKGPMDAWRLKPLAIYTKSPFGDCIVMDQESQSTEVDFGALARDFSHRARACHHETDLTDFREIYPFLFHGLHFIALII